MLLRFRTSLRSPFSVTLGASLFYSCDCSVLTMCVFMYQKPSNCDDSGFFSIQVLQQALTVWNIELRPITSPDAVCALARDDPRYLAIPCQHHSQI